MRLIMGLLVLGLSFSGRPGYALNGSALIAVSPAGQALGGTGVARPTAITESLHKNSSLINSAKLANGQTSLEFDMTYLNQNAKTSIALTGTTEESKYSSRFIPQIGAVHKVNEKLTLGLGYISYAGTMGNYSGVAAASEQRTKFGVSKVVPTVAYTICPTLSIGFAPIIGIGEFMLNENVSSGVQSAREPHMAFGLGAQVGASYTPIDNLSIGIAYISESTYYYKNLTDIDAFGTTGKNGLDNLELQQPMELALGVAYTPIDMLTLVADYRFIGWSGADALREFGWKDQNVFAVGSEVRLDKLALRAGANFANAALESVLNEVNAPNTQINLQGHLVLPQSVSSLNVFSFPASSKTHLTFGAGYQVTEDINVDAGFVYALKSNLRRSGNLLPAGTYDNDTASSQWSINLGGTMRL